MRIAIEPTDRLVIIDGQTPCRIWEGTTDKGTRVFVYVRAIAVAASECDDAEMSDLIEVTGVDKPELGIAGDFGLADDTTFRAKA